MHLNRAVIILFVRQLTQIWFHYRAIIKTFISIFQDISIIITFIGKYLIFWRFFNLSAFIIVFVNDVVWLFMQWIHHCYWWNSGAKENIYIRDFFIFIWVLYLWLDLFNLIISAISKCFWVCDVRAMFVWLHRLTTLR